MCLGLTCILTGVLGEDDGTPGDVSETGKAEFLKTEHLVDHEAVVDEQLDPTDVHQGGEQVSQATEPLHPVTRRHRHGKPSSSTDTLNNHHYES